MSLFSKKNKPIVGLDIGSNAVKMIEIIVNKGIPRLESFASQTLDPEIMRGGMLRDPEKLRSSLTNIFADSGINTHNIVLGIPKREVLAKAVKYPRMPIEDIKNSLQWEFEKHFPFSIQDASFDVAQLYLPGYSEQDKEMDLLLVAVKKGIVDLYLQVCEMAELELSAVEPPVSSAQRLISYVVEAQEDKIKGGDIAIDIGASASAVYVFLDGAFLIQRLVMTGGNAFTAAIQAQKGLAFEEADKLKLSNDPDIKSELTDSYQVLTKEIQNSISYVRGQYRDFKPDRMHLFGGAVDTIGLKQYLKESFDAKISTLDSLTDFQEYDDIDNPGELGLALGYALRAIA